MQQTYRVLTFMGSRVSLDISTLSPTLLETYFTIIIFLLSLYLDILMIGPATDPQKMESCAVTKLEVRVVGLYISYSCNHVTDELRFAL